MNLLLHLLAGNPDRIDIQATSADDEDDDPSNASARIIVYNSTAKIGECWYDTAGTETKKNDVILPNNAKITDYQMKWESLSGDDPSSYSVAVSTWLALSSDDFWVAWGQTEVGSRTGSITVSIRRGTGSVLDTAVWDGDAVVNSP